LIAVRRIAYPMAAVLILCLIWDASVVGFGVSPLILPRPLDVIRALVKYRADIFHHSLITLLESLAGFILAALAGMACAMIFVVSPKVAEAFYPILLAIKMIPLIALAPLVVVWFGTGFASKVIMSAVVSFFPVLVNGLQGLQSVGPDLYDIFSSLSAERWQILWKLRLPSAIGYMFAGLRVSVVFSLIGAMVAEFIGASNGIGYFIKSASYYSSSDSMMAGILATAMIGLAMYGGVVLLERASPRWSWALTNQRA
jgi:NitT/TauT family transport system permease protein